MGVWQHAAQAQESAHSPSLVAIMTQCALPLPTHAGSAMNATQGAVQVRGREGAECVLVCTSVCTSPHSLPSHPSPSITSVARYVCVALQASEASSPAGQQQGLLQPSLRVSRCWARPKMSTARGHRTDRVTRACLMDGTAMCV